MTISTCLWTAPFVLALGAATLARDTGRLEVHVIDEHGADLPCRIHLAGDDGKPVRAPGLPFWRDHFVCAGRVDLEVAPGEYRYTVERGPEHAARSGAIDVSGETRLEVTLSRIARLRDEGWFSGDLHVHRSLEDIELLMRAEDLDFAAVTTWWNRRNLWKGRDLPGETTRRSDGHRLHDVMTGEDERQGGALLFLGLDRPLDIASASREYPSPMRFVRDAVERRPDVWIDIEKPFWRDVPTWLASGLMRSIGLANNHMCRSRMLESEAWGRPRDIERLPPPRGNGFWTQEIYYHMLEAGLRLPPSAGSASGVLPNPVGYNRVYVHVDGEFTRQSWFEGLAAGRSFVTNGPLLRVRANGLLPGGTLASKDDERLQVDFSVELTSRDRVARLEVVHNGRIAHVAPVSGDTPQTLRVELEAPGWVLVRALCDNQRTFRFASTAPWFVESGSATRRISERSARFFLDWVTERIAEVESRVADPGKRREVLEPHQSAAEFWSRRVAMATHRDGAASVESTSARAAAMPVVERVEPQPLLAASARVALALESLGSPLPDAVRSGLAELSPADDARTVTRRVQELLDPLCLAAVSVSDSGAPIVRKGQVEPELVEQGWRVFLVKVVNRPGLRGRLLVDSPNARPLPHAPAEEVASRWMGLSTFEGQPLSPDLGGLALEYRVLQLSSRDAGLREGLLEFTVAESRDEGGALLRRWRFGEGTDGWRAMSQCELEVRGGSLHVNSSGEDPFMGADVDAPGGPMTLRFWAESAEGGVAEVFWWTKERPRPDGGRRRNFLIEPGEARLYEVAFDVEGRLAGVRLDPLIRPGSVRIDWIDLYSSRRTASWARLPVRFRAVPATPVSLRVLDAEGKPGFARFEIRDSAGRVHPAQSKRLAPDFFFQRHIYRGDGETVPLPAGDYTVVCSRGPESIPETKTLRVGQEPVELTYRVRRWIDPARRGWWSGDHHIHAAGCLHYESPTQGVQPGDMLRHIMGEDVKVGCCLTWGPCFDYQKRFFTGKVAEQSRYPYLLRYDVEVSGFGSHRSGHLNLLGLEEQIYPGGESKEHWPTLGLNTLRWAKRQGAICGPAHSAIGLTRFVGRVPGTEGKDGPGGLPHFRVPAYDGIGANEFIVDVTHEVPGPDGKPVPAVDFISAMDTDRNAEWNMWYHVLNCGFRVAVSGETDFPCISGERVGMGRSYAEVDGRLTFKKWVRSLADGRSYVSDGSCHLMDFAAESQSVSARVGREGSELRLERGETVRLSVSVAARLEKQPELPVELIVNGFPVSRRTVRADGELSRLDFETSIEQSSWMAVRVFPHAHTNPIHVVVAGKPTRASADSARWCLLGVEQCWKSKQGLYAADEQDDARAAYDHARAVYRRILGESR